MASDLFVRSRAAVCTRRTTAPASEEHRNLDNLWMADMNFGKAAVVEDNRRLQIGLVKRRDVGMQKDLVIGVHMIHLDHPL